MKKFNRIVGSKAEEYAARALIKKGYAIVKRNFSNRFGEIDIIAKDGETLVFVEVKAKTGNRFGTPEEMVSKWKLNQIRKMAEIYMEGKNLPCRIDVIAILLDPASELLRLTHYQNVY